MLPTDISGRKRELRILVVDDDPGLGRLTSQILREAGFEVLTAENGKEAMNLLESTDVDLVLTDLAMPEQDGFETIKMLRDRRPGVKIIAMSGRFGDLLHVAKILGADATLAKPIRPAELLETVRRVIVR
jgi:DNA-binding response OmpR family regulator